MKWNFFLRMLLALLRHGFGRSTVNRSSISTLSRSSLRRLDMTEAVEEEAPPAPKVISNTTVVQDAHNRLTVYVGGQRIVNIASVNITHEGFLAVVLPPHAYRLASDPAQAKPVLETKDNVIVFPSPLMDEYRAKWKREEEEKNKTTVLPPDDKPEGAA
jgi:hypothetical protein